MIRSRVGRDPGALYWGIAIVSAALVAWEVWASSSVDVRLLLSSPSLTFLYFGHHMTEIGKSFVYTGLESVLDLIIATTFALSFGVVCIYYPRVGQISLPLLIASQVVPLICLAPMIILLCSPGPSGKVLLSALVACFPILTNLISGIRSVPSAPQEVMHIMAAPKAEVIRHVVIPHCVDHFFAGMRIAAPLSVIGAIVAGFTMVQMQALGGTSSSRQSA
jgi:ABC-type nitrate/sulfonate/bicarbonate transport system permease component